MKNFKADCDVAEDCWLDVHEFTHRSLFVGVKGTGRHHVTGTLHRGVALSRPDARRLRDALSRWLAKPKGKR